MCNSEKSRHLLSVTVKARASWYDLTSDVVMQFNFITLCLQVNLILKQNPIMWQKRCACTLKKRERVIISLCVTNGIMMGKNYFTKKRTIFKNVAKLITI